MDEAQKREKVIKGLECCNALHNGGTVKCGTECPYGIADGIDRGCRYKLIPDALALIKAQEAIKPQKMENDYIRKEPIVFSYRCPACFTCLQKHWDTCPVCGQKVKWR